MLAQQRGGALELHRGLAELDLVAADLHVAGRGMGQRHEHLPGAGNVGIGHDTVDGVDGSGGAAGSQDDLHSLVDGIVLQPVLDDGL